MLFTPNNKLLDLPLQELQINALELYRIKKKKNSAPLVKGGEVKYLLKLPLLLRDVS